MKRAAFTLVEILVALAFIGVLLPAVVSGLQMANRASVIADRATIAAQLAENQLAELVLDDAWSTGEARGDFNPDHRGYTWQLAQRTWPEGAMTELTLEVHFQVQGQDHSVTLATLVTTPSATTTGGLTP